MIAPNINNQIISTIGKYLNLTHSSPLMLLRKYFRFSPADLSPEWVSNPATLSTSPKLKYKTFVPLVTRLNTWSYVEILRRIVYLNKKAIGKNVSA